MRLLGRWLDDRTGLVTAARRFFAEPIPSSIGWWQTLGSLTGALLLVQVLTGALLAFYYVPHPDAAYQSVLYVEQQVVAGRLVRALHYWGASFVVVAAFLHMVRVFCAGAYKAPRDANWLAGLTLLGLVVALAFTGQLLPWNQTGFWSAKVGIEIAASAPLVGPGLKRLLTGGASVGALTLSRFYALHAVVLPALLGLFVMLHLYLLRRHGPLRPAWDEGSATVPFHPTQLARDLILISLGLATLFAVARWAGGPTAGVIDPTDTNYLPRPAWYFQAHYQLLRVTPGSLKVLATVVLPAGVALVLMALPWIDRGPGRRFSDRRPVVVTGLALAAGLAGLTAYGTAADVPEPPAPRPGTYDPVEAGRALYAQENCRKCHTIGLEGGTEGPDLTNVGARLQEAYLRKFLRNPQGYVPDVEMPAVKLPARQFEELVAFLKSLREE